MNVIHKVTLEWMKKNRTRTLVTIIGIILSASMITAVTTLISSVQNYVINVTIASEGNWHGLLQGVNPKDASTFMNMDEIENSAVVKSGGYAYLKGSKNEYKPYLYIMEMSREAFDLLPVYLVSGRLPENENEVLVSEHIISNGGVRYEEGDVLILDTGRRVADDGIILGQRSSYSGKENGISERIEVTETKTFTVVGICRRLSNALEPYTAPGYTIITMMNESRLTDSDRLDVYFTVRNPAKIFHLGDKLKGISFSGIEYNDELLRFMGISDNDTFNFILYNLGAILILLIMAGSVLLIYNSFSISVSERKRQFGLLSSVGATPKQLRHSVLFEATVLGAVGIPLGVLSGILGIGITLCFIDDLLAKMLTTYVPVPLTLSVSVLSVVIAVVVAYITILISAWIPARRATRISALDAIRQTTDIKLTAKQVKTSGLARKMFGIEGDIALKNMKRNRKRYRSTVLSLFMSIVLFISATAFTMYIKDSVMSVYEDEKYDLAYNTAQRGDLGDAAINAYREILALNSVELGSIVRRENGHINLSKGQVSEAFYKEFTEKGFIKDGEDISTWMEIYAVDHDTFVRYVRELGLDLDENSGDGRFTGIVVDNLRFYDPTVKKLRNISVFEGKNPEVLSVQYEVPSVQYSNQGYQTVSVDIRVAAVANKAPFGIMDYVRGYGLMLIVDDNIRKDAFPGGFESGPAYMYFSSDDPFRAQKEMEKILIEEGLGQTGYLINIAEKLQLNRNFLTIISVFSYGFIVLISLITTANIFNTISTNVNLRRREFAMLKSVGMTDESFRRMINYECIFYGLKALVYGIPVSVFITYLIYSSVAEGIDMGFKLPVHGILISVLSVFSIVFASMVYSMSKIRKENILEVLVNENL